MSNLLLVSAAALIDFDGRVLIAKRPAGTFMPGYWEFPGGKIEQGESPEQALHREIMEELGVKLGCFWPFTFISEKRAEHHVLVFLYLCREWAGIPVGMEGQELKWVRPLELPKIENMLPSNQPLVTFLRDHLTKT